MHTVDSNQQDGVLAVALGTADLRQTTISVADFGGDYVTVAYRGLPGNQPRTYDNTVFMWRASVVPWGVPPYGTQRVTADSQDGDVTMGNITVTLGSHVVCYSTAATPSAVCASATIDSGGSVANADAVSIGVQSIGVDSVVVRYHVLTGYLPGRYGNWIGLWKGEVSPYHCPDPLGMLLVPDRTDGTVVIRGVDIAIRSTYTLVYFMADPNRVRDNATAAALLTFTTTRPGAPDTRR